MRKFLTASLEYSHYQALNLASLLAIGGDLTHTGPAIYMGIITDDNNPGTYFLYVGQTKNLARRLGEHQNKVLRDATPCLHYYVLKAASRSEKFVVLANLSLLDEAILPYCLNILEMLGCLAFQTLPEKTLLQYLPQGSKVSSPGAHLNVASPLAQGCSKAERSFSLLAHSSNPLIRAYYQDRRKKGYARMQETWINRAVHTAIEGGEVELKMITETRPMPRARFHLRDVTVTISPEQLEELGRTYGDKVRVEYELSEEPHPMPFASKARFDDPAIRLGIKIIGKTTIWASSGGDLMVKKANTLVDELAGVSFTEITGRPRRYLRENINVGRSKASYT